MSGQWNPYARENETEQEPREVSEGLEAEDLETDSKSDHRFKRRVD
jgi:hypothetical protein